LSKSKDVLNVEEQQVRGGSLYLVALHHMVVDLVQLLVDLRVDVVTVCGDQLLEVQANGENNFALVDYRIQGIPHFMGDSRVDETQKFTLGL
jgi:UDP-N-acetylglucosamine:LPS N-acetylglucosamine transferase